MRSKLLKTIIFSFLAVALILAPFGILGAVTNDSKVDTYTSEQNAATIGSKDEVIYATLTSNGSLYGVHVVNHFEVLSAGMFTDYGTYDSVSNLTTLDSLSNNGDSVTLTADKGNFYYQGNISRAKLPWSFDISYYLDSTKILASELGGKSGELEIHISSTRDKSVDSTFYDHYMLQISLTLDVEKCSNIDAPGATMASAGKNTVAAYTVMPGTDANIVLSASVRDFIMTGIDITGMPFSMSFDIPDTNDMLSEFSILSDAISELNDGVGELSTGAKQLSAGAKGLVNGSSSFKQGLSELDSGAEQLAEGSAQINMAFIMLSASLNNQSTLDLNLDELSQLPWGLSQLSLGLRSVSSGLKELKSGFTAAYSALDAAIATVPDTVITQDQITTLYSQTNSSQYSLLNELVASYTAAQTIKGTYDQVKRAFDAVGSTVDTLSPSIDTMASSLDEMSEGISKALESASELSQLEQLLTMLSQLATRYKEFHNGLLEYTDGISALSSGYGQFHPGLMTYSEGMGDFSQGIDELYGGTKTLHAETKNLPNIVQSEIDKLLSEYTGSDFTPVSFTSKNNKGVNLVQFVLKCDPIEKLEEAAKVPVEEEKTSFWNRLLDLFR